MLELGYFDISDSVNFGIYRIRLSCVHVTQTLQIFLVELQPFSLLWRRKIQVHEAMQ